MIPQRAVKETRSRYTDGLGMRGGKVMNNTEPRGGRVSGGGLCGFQVCARGSALVRELIPHLSTCRLVRHSLRFQTCTNPGGVRERESCSDLFRSS